MDWSDVVFLVVIVIGGSFGVAILEGLYNEWRGKPNSW